MNLQRELKFEDYVTIFRRRIWFLVIPGILLCIGAYVLSLFLPSRYTSETVVLVQEQRVPEEYVRSVVGGDLNERLATMQEQILSRTRLQEIIEKLKLYKEDIGRRPMEELVARLRKSITVGAVRPMAETHAEGLPGFTIAVTASRPGLAQQICTEITSLFLQQNVVLRAQRAEDTTQFLNTQLADAKAKLDEQGAKLADFKRRYMGSLPDEAQTNFGLLTAMSTQLEALNQSIDRAHQDKIFLESNLSSQLSATKLAETGASPDILGKQMAALQEELSKLRTRYTDAYPDIVKLKRDIADLQKRMSAENASRNSSLPKEQAPTPTAATAFNPRLEELRAEIHQLDVGIREKIAEQQQVQQKIQQLQSRLELTPGVEEQYKALTRDSQTALEIYTDLLKKQNESAMATDLEKRQEGEQFRVLDPPSLPQTPSFPKRQEFAIGGLIGGLALGGLIGFMLELKDTSLRTERDVEMVLKLPTLATIPTVPMEAPARKNGRQTLSLQNRPGSMQIDAGV